MPVTVARIEDAPVMLIARMSGTITPNDFEDMNQQTDDLIMLAGTPIFRIFDVRRVTVNVNNMLTTFKAIQSSAGDDPRIHPVILGNSQWTRLIREILKGDRRPQLPVPLFATMEQALDYIDRCLEREPIG